VRGQCSADLEQPADRLLDQLPRPGAVFGAALTLDTSVATPSLDLRRADDTGDEQARTAAGRAQPVIWEEIGVALGISKQGAWARLRAAVGEQGGQGTMHDPVQTKQRVRELWNAGQARLSEMDTTWREEQQRLRQQVHESKDRLAEARRHHAQERREARQNLRREMEKLRKEIDPARAIS
jgi:serine phosphatase RsbU (regulator of sigma subunit)